jgi:hypothetical protein
MPACGDVLVCCVHNVLHVVDLIRAPFCCWDVVGERVLHLQEEVIMFRRLGTENLNAFVMIQKNWPFDARTYTLSESDITQFFNDEAELLDIHEEELIAAGELE